MRASYYMGSTRALFRMSLLKKCFALGAVAVVLLAAAAGGGYFWATSPVTLSAPVVDVTIKPHSSVRSVALQLVRAGVALAPEPFVLMTRALGLQTRLKSGN